MCVCVESQHPLVVPTSYDPVVAIQTAVAIYAVVAI